MRVSQLNTYLYALGAGALLPLAFAPFQLWPLAYLSFVAIGYVLYHYTNPFYLGFCFGLGLFGVGVSWVFVSIQFYGGNPAWLSLLITLIFVAFLAIYPGVYAYILKRWIGLKPSITSVLAAASLWTLLEGARATWFSGFPWLLTGFSQIDTPLICLAPLIGVYGLSWLVVWISGNVLLVFLDLYRQKVPLRSLALLCILFLAILVCQDKSWTVKSKAEPMSVALVQGNIAQLEKWDDAYLDDIVKQYLSLTEDHWDKDLVVWPESAIPKPLPYADDIVEQLHVKATQHQNILITGIPIVQNDGFTNSIITIGNQYQRYDKVHLVPFGEFVPFKSWLYPFIESMGIPMIDFIHGNTKQPPLQAGHLLVAPFICYEIAFDQALLSERMQRSGLMITLSNDAWFGDSFAPHQHLEIARMRSAQTGRYQLFATNDGITAVIDTMGNIQSKAPLHQAFVLHDTIQAHHGQTPWMRFGHMWVWIWVYISFAAIALYRVLRQYRLRRN